METSPEGCGDVVVTPPLLDGSIGGAATTAPADEASLNGFRGGGIPYSSHSYCCLALWYSHKSLRSRGAGCLHVQRSPSKQRCSICHLHMPYSSHATNTILPVGPRSEGKECKYRSCAEHAALSSYLNVALLMSKATNLPSHASRYPFAACERMSPA
jgi:hypothetical protein